MTVFFYICEYFGITPQEFFDEGAVNPTLLNELINEIRPLDEYAQKNLLEFIKKSRETKK